MKKFTLFLFVTLALLSAPLVPTTTLARRAPQSSAMRARREAPREAPNTKNKKGKKSNASQAAPAARPLLTRSQERESSPTPVSARATRFAVSPPVSEMGNDDKETDSMRRGKDPEVERAEKVVTPPLSGFTDSPAALAASIQSSAPTLNIASPSSTFEGLSNQDNFNHPSIGFRVLPPDTVGDVGPTQYVQAVNLLFRVYSKTGTPLTPIRPISALFTALGGRCATTDDGDPIVLYDSFADRWMITQFMVSGAAPLAQCVAVSQTGDAAGAYYTYEFVMPNAKFNDYPHFGVWPDGYYFADNQFNLAGTAFLGVGVFALDRAKLLAGDPTASYIYFDLETAVPNARSMLPSDADGLTPPPAGAPNVFSYFNANEFVGETDSLRLYNFHADFAVPANSTFTQRPESPVAVAAFDPRNPAGQDDIEQPPPANSGSALDSISDRLMNRLQYRNFGTHESLVVNHTVNVGTGTTLATHQAGVRYYELRRAGAGPWGVNEQATFAPDATNRWMGSAAMDGEGNLAVGYSASSTTVFPSIRYAGRLASDPPGGLFQGENTIVAGGFSQAATGSRWGDYSSLNVDPTDDCTFFYTQEYYAADNPATTAEWQTHVGSFKVNPACTAPAQGTLQVNVTDCDSGLPLAGASVIIDGNLYGTSLPPGGSFSTQLPPGTYPVSVTKFNYTVGAGTATITDGNTTVLNLCATPTAVIAPAGSALGAESCGPDTDAIDPGETVTVDLSLKNSGAANTSNLVATLLPTGGVTSPSGPESYGVVVAGGPSVTKSFTFTASGALACGDDITATLQLQDGANNLGTVTYTFSTGALGAPTSGSYSSGNVAVAINDNSTVDIPINVPDTGSVTDVNVRVRLNHTFDGDVEMRLVHPDGTIVLLSDNRGGSGDNFGTGTNDCAGAHTVFDDGAAAPISSGVAPFAGSFKPEQSLSALNGKATSGTWRLRVSDTANADTGTVGCVQLEINRLQRLCCPFAGGTPTVVAAPPADLTAESCAPANDAIDPEETVTVELPLKNNGTGPTTNLVATLVAGGGISPVTASQNYGALSPVGAGSTASRPFTFVAQGPCGGTVTATLQLQDGANNLGTVSFNFVLGATVTNVHTFSNNNPITILDTPRISTIAPSSPYPSSISVASVAGTVTKVGVRLKNMSHTFPDDVDILLVGPGGQKFIVMSDAGTGNDIVNTTITLDDAAAAPLPDSATITTGTFRPSNYGTGDAFPAPAPPAPYQSPATAGAATSASVFGGTNPNGTWSLYVVDDAGSDAGSISGGWDLILTTQEPACCDSPCTITPPANVVVNNDAGSCGAFVNYPPATVNGSCGVLTYSHPSGSFFPVGTTTVQITATRADNTTSTASFTVTVNDAEGPSVSGPVASPSSLWPPNHQMKNVTVSYNATDNCTTPGAISCTLSVTSNEPVDGADDGNTAPDWLIVSPTKVQLRAERSGSGSGRVYTIAVTCTDSAGNQTVKTTTVSVPYSQ